MSPLSETDFTRPSPTVLQRVLRALVLAVGWAMIGIGAVFALLPGHLGLLLLVPGLIVVLRESRPARRHFIDLQRRHPKIIFPIRRLLRREPEVFPVAWQQVLRMERWILPKSWRPARRIRRKLLGRGRRNSR